MSRPDRSWGVLQAASAAEHEAPHAPGVDLMGRLNKRVVRGRVSRGENDQDDTAHGIPGPTRRASKKTTAAGAATQAAAKKQAGRSPAARDEAAMQG
ncbi:hypothetical protein OHA61_39350 [Streptomyces sp. NBC_00885]|uniref:hypothetical protein n=1 Tax=Streptomyces sp. NBC_00885 TaxID=2975857 RepID=UPI003865DC17|nr:hypothetical protein OHA61_39350 [Streptomyces sp. NBC_00885]